MLTQNTAVVRRAWAFATCAILAGCGAPKLYSNNIKIDYDGPQRPAAIQVSDPKVFQRHAMINERRDEQAYLEQQLSNSVNASFAPDLMREVETVRTLSLALGLSFDAGVRDKAQATSETNDLAQQIAVENLRAKLAQVQRDVELLKVKLSEQTTPSTTIADATRADIAGVTMPVNNNVKELITELNARIAALTAQLDRQSPAPRLSAATGSPEEQFDDRQALRKKILANMHANSLDALHDMGANSLFRLQFQAMVLPEGRPDPAPPEGAEADRKGRQLGLLEMSLKRPEIPEKDLQRELQALYFQWLDYATNNLNPTSDGSDIRTDASLYQLGLDRRAMTILYFNSGVLQDGAKSRTKPAAKPDMGNVGVYRNSVTLHNITGYRQMLVVPPTSIWAEARGSSKSDGKAKDKSAGQPGTTESAARTEFGAPTCKFGLLGIGDAAKQKDCKIFRIAYPPSIGTKEIEKLLAVSTAGLEAVVDHFKTAASAGSSGDQARQICVDASTAIEPYKDLLHNKNALRHLQHTYSWAYLKSDVDNAEAAEEAAAVNERLGVALVQLEKAAGIARTLRCTGGNWAPDPAADEVPQAFIEALYQKPDESGGKWRARGRLAVYAVTPASLMQRVSTAARAADAIQMAASLAASLPARGIGANAGLGYMRSVTGKIDSLERVPLVVGYSTGAAFDSTDVERKETAPARFGWLLGPKVVINSEKQALAFEFSLAPYDLAADVSMPGWWPQLVLESRSAWAPQWDIARNRLLADSATSAPHTTVVPIRHTPADMEGITLMLLNSTQNDGEGGGAGLRLPTARITQIEPVNVSDCAGATTFVVKGSNLWRAEKAFLSGVEASKIEVMPDMGGVSVTFDITRLQPGAGDARLVVPTPEGDAFGIVQVQGDRGIAAACGVKAPDDGSPAIASVIPEVVYACDRNQRLIVRGKHLTAPEAAMLGNLALTWTDGAVSADGKLMELTLNGAIGKSGGSQNKLPLVVKMKGGYAIANVPIERGSCGGGEGASGQLKLISGPVDVCKESATTIVIGKGASRASSAQLVSTMPKFTLNPSSISFNRTAQSLEVGFVGFPKGAVTGPDKLAPSMKLVLKSSKGVESSVEVPTVCSAYAK